MAQFIVNEAKFIYRLPKKTKKVGVVLLYYNDLREEVRRLKWEDKYSYKEIAEYLEIKPRSLYNWLAG